MAEYAARDVLRAARRAEKLQRRAIWRQAIRLLAGGARLPEIAGELGVPMQLLLEERAAARLRRREAIRQRAAHSATTQLEDALDSWAVSALRSAR